jgi:spore germination cell wall hydrolase CwlJ-like protein
MLKQHQSKRRLLLAITLFLFLFAGMTVSAQAARKENSDGTYSYYNSKNVLQKNKWIKSGDKTYYADENGILYANGVYQIGKYWYGFGKHGSLQYGKCKIGGKTYYFAEKNGRMQTAKWINTDGHHYYFNEDGTMAKSQWVGRYYVGKDGTRVKKKWQGNCYLGEDGKAYTGLHKIGKYYYYFDKKTYEKITDQEKTVKGKSYTFDSKGRGKLTSDATKGYEKSMFTDPAVDDETLLAAIIYCESGNQSYTGQVAVGMVIMNRMYSARFPNTLKEVVYQKQQFEPTRNGSLTKALKSSTLVTDQCKKAAAEVLEKYQDYKAGKKVNLKINKKNVNFSSYLFFMTKAAYNRLGLSASKKTIGAHVFFKTWR